MNTFFKNILFSGLIYTVFIQFACAGNTSSLKEVNPESESIEEKVKFNFKSDSGYISSAEAFNFLISNALIDTISRKSENDYIQYSYKSEDSTVTNSTYYCDWYSTPTDTIGKYYKIESGNFIVALSLGREIFLLEVTSGSDFINSELYGHGSYACCWNDIDDMLKRYGSYLGVMTCGTGSAYCSTYITFFKRKLISQAGVPIYEFWGGFGEAIPGHILTSDMQFKDSCLTVQYTLKEFIFNEQDEEQIISTKSFPVNYFFKEDSGFYTNENDKLEDILF